MRNDPFKIIDKSGDRKYFTIIPNYIVNHSTVYEQAIYLYMKRVAGEDGTCWMSAMEIAKRLDCSRNTIAKYQKKLVERGWIEVVGHHATGETNQQTIEYRIVDLWSLNIRHYEEKSKRSNSERLPLSLQPVNESVQLVNSKRSTIGHKEEPLKKKEKEEVKAQMAEVPMTLKEFVKWCEASSQKHIRIIGNWADTIEPDFQTKSQWEAFIRRNVRPAKNLEPFEDKRLIEGFKKIQEAVKAGWLKKYTLETLFKFIV
ncbi:MAG: helix-turn-helix domain-containing protein [Candidatus Taylorbacteria bacterium]|nr:helix-turn-helix domain-containing protein [Candidatus Taylorbacteria bacterium]